MAEQKKLARHVTPEEKQRRLRRIVTKRKLVKSDKNVWSERLILLDHHTAESMGSFTKIMFFFVRIIGH